MSRIDRYLDGDLDRSALTDDERALAEKLEGSIEEARSYVAARPAPDVTARVLARIDGARPSRGWGWHALVERGRELIWTSRRVSIRLRPIYVLGVLVLLAPSAARCTTAWFDGTPARLEAPAPGASSPAVFVRFRLEAPGAHTVSLAGTFTNWEARFDLQEVAPGVWSGLLPVPIGVHDYAFLIDGTRWLADPDAPQVSDGFGGMNSRLALLFAGPAT